MPRYNSTTLGRIVQYSIVVCNAVVVYSSVRGVIVIVIVIVLVIVTVISKNDIYKQSHTLTESGSIKSETSQKQVRYKLVVYSYFSVFRVSLKPLSGVGTSEGGVSTTGLPVSSIIMRFDFPTLYTVS